MPLLVSGCIGGGVYLVDVKNKQVNQIIEIGDYRGMVKFNDQIIVLSNDHGILILNKQFDIVRIKPLEGLDLHGCAVYRNKLYIVETARNTIGIYDLPKLSRIGEIRFANENYDVLHMNDIDIIDDRLFVSMFIYYKDRFGKRAPIIFDNTVNKGTILEFSLRKARVIKVHFNQLRYPHSVTYHNNEIYYCNTFPGLEVKRGDKTVLHTEKYPRGLAFEQNIIYIGQSANRHQAENSNADIIIFDTSNNMSEKIPLPCPEVYCILSVN